MAKTMISPAPTPPIGLRASKSSGFPQKHLWGGLTVGIATVMFGLMIYCFVKRRYWSALREKWKRKGEINIKGLQLRKFELEELMRATKNFSDECLLGSGAFGNVYKGTFDEEGTLAIKKAHTDSYQDVQEFRTEVELLSRVKHRNLIGLVGYCEQFGGKGTEGVRILVYEYASNGSLLEYIIGRNGKSLAWRQRVNIAIGAAKGIAHLHEGVNPSIIHRDIKPSNILIGDGLEPKVSDFGLVKSGPIGDQSHVSSQIKGTPGYLDPAYCSSFHLSPKSDVYSFGVILLQLISARPAVDSTKNNANYHIIEWARSSLDKGSVEDIIDVNLLTEPCNMEIMLKMGQLGLRCTVKMPKNRPTMTQVWHELEDALDSTDNIIRKRSSRSSRRSLGSSRRSADMSQSFSLDAVGLQRFHVEMDSLSFQSTSLRCLENNSISIDVEKGNLVGITEESSRDASLERFAEQVTSSA